MTGTWRRGLGLVLLGVLAALLLPLTTQLAARTVAGTVGVCVATWMDGGGCTFEPTIVVQPH